ncbi:MAG: cupin domain-containing protein [Actinomycetota bacterium]|jgi:quercetin dioxygenase-like cupin family protein|nr:cupin domain-containing protein [Actinomycetota bacterium]
MQPFEPVAVDLRDYVDFDLAEAVGRRVFTTDVVAVDLVCLEPGQQIDARTLAGADAIYTVLGGRAWVVTDEAEVTLEPLQAVVVPAGIPHGVRNDGADPLILQLVVSPPDELPDSVEGPAAQAADLGAQNPPPPAGLRDRLRRTLGGGS